MCTYNGESHIEAQLQSIAAQTVLPDELVICDDGSDDATIAIIAAFQESGSVPIRLFPNTDRLGSKRNFEKAMQLCDGDIIVLSDQDDVWEADRVALCRDRFAHNSIGYMFSDARLIAQDGGEIGGRLWQTLGFDPAMVNRFNGGQDQASLILRQPFVTGATLALRRELIRHALPLPDEAICNFHHDRWIALALSASGHWGHAEHQSLIRYRIHAAQQVGLQQIASRWRLTLRWINRRTRALRRPIAHLRIMRELERRFGRDMVRASCRPNYFVRLLLYLSG